MELAPFQRFVAFIAVVVLLAGIGAYLFLPSASGSAGGGSGAPAHLASHRPSGSAAATAPGTSPVPGQPGGPGTGGQSPPDIYQWLPFTRPGLAAAAQTAVAFADDYGTYSYSQDATAYLAPMRPLITSQLAELIGRAYSAPGVAADRTSKHQVSSGQAVIGALRAYGPTSLTFVIQLTQRITSSSGSSQQATSYAVTLIGGGASWQVSDIELASAGNS